MAPRKERPQAFKERQDQLKKNKLVKRPIARLDSAIVSETKERKGRQRRFTPATMRNGINRYFLWCEENDQLPSIKGLMIHLKMYKDAFYEYLKYPEFTQMLEHARMIICEWAESDVYNTPGQASAKIAYMKNLHGWSDKIDTNSTTVQVNLTPEEAKAKIERLAPKLLEALKASPLLTQLVQRKEVPNAAEAKKKKEKVIEAQVA